MGNRLWNRALSLAKLVAEQDGFFILEHPRGVEGQGCRLLRVDMCAYEGASNAGLPNQKPTSLLTNALWVSSVLKQCPKDNVHGPPFRGARAETAGAYPWALADACFAWASAGRPTPMIRPQYRRRLREAG